MAFTSFMKLFSPKDKVFYGLFEEVAKNGAIMAEHLAALVAETDRSKRATMIGPIEDLEHANDELTHRIFTELGRNFITPFDREDIHYLASALDDVADFVFASAKKINFYRVARRSQGKKAPNIAMENVEIPIKLRCFL